MAKKGKGKKKPQTQNDYTSSFSSLRWADNNDVEPAPTRNPDYARRLMRAIDTDIPATALEEICTGVMSSSAGDEAGFAIEEDPLNPRHELLQPIRDFLTRCFDLHDYLQIVHNLVGLGDAFLWADVPSNLSRIDRVLILPTFQIFRHEDPQGQLLGFEQRLPGIHTESSVLLSPVTTFQISYRRSVLYGKSLFHEVIEHIEALQDGCDDLRQVSRAIGYQPNLHIMPPGKDGRYKQAYKDDYEHQKKRGPVPDVYLEHGGILQKPYGSTLPGSADLVTNIDRRRRFIAARSHVPGYLLGTVDPFARDIALQPALAFVRFLGLVRQLLAVGLRELISLELSLLGYEPPYPYLIKFPYINTRATDPDLDSPVVEDLQDANN